MNAKKPRKSKKPAKTEAPSGKDVLPGDAAERKRTEEDAEPYRRLIAAMTMGFALHEIVCDASGKPVDYTTLEVNAAFEQLLGVTRESVVGRKVSAFMSPEELEHWLGIFAPVALTGLSTHYEMYSPVNHRYFAGNSFCPEPGRFTTVFTDITERRRAEDEVRTILRTTMDGYYLVDMAGKFLDTNDAYCGMIGYSREELVTMGVKDIEAVDTDERIRQRIQRIMETGYVRFETQHRRKDGRVIDIEASVNILKDGGGKLVVFMRDITERKRAAEALSETSARYRVLFEQSPDGIVVLDPTTARFLEFNDAAHRQLGYSREEFAQLSIADLDVVETPEETRAHIARYISDGRSDFETRQRTKQGEIRNIHVTAQVIPVPGRNVYHCVWRDVTERRRAESRLSEEQRRLSTILATVGDPIFVKNNDHRFVLANRAFYDMLGLEEEDVIGRTLGESLPADEMRHFLAVDRRVLDTGVPETCEEVLTARNGVQLTIVTRKTRFLDDFGNAFLVGAIHDITDSRKAEEALLERQARLEDTQRLAKLGSWSWDIATDTVTWSEELFRIAGRDPAGPAPTYAEHPQVFTPESFARLSAAVDRALAQGEPYELDLELVRPDGAHRGVIGRGQAVSDAAGRVIGLLGTLLDITERKRAEAALRESEERFRSVYEDATLGLYRTTPDGRILLANPALVQMLGYASFEELAARGLEHGDAYEPGYSRAEFLQRIDASGEVRGLESGWRRKDGTLLTVRENARAVRDASGRLLYCDGVVEDISDRRRMEEALHASEERFRAIALSTPDSVLTQDRDLRYEFVLNPGAGRTPEEMVGRTDEDFRQPEEAARLTAIKRQVLETGRPVHLQVPLTSVTGEAEVFEGSYVPRRGADGEIDGLFGYFRSVTSRLRAEREHEELRAKLLQAQKAEGLGRMAGAIAHHYNNLLGAVLLNLELAQRTLPSDAGARKYLADATTVSQRAAELSHQMLAYLGQGRGKREPTDLCEVCREALPLLRATLPAHARLHTEFPAEGAVVRADALQLKRVLTSLAANASEAIGDGHGSVTVAIDLIPAADIHAPRFFPAGWEPTEGTYACLSVADAGCGMTPEILDTAFDPFFSTRFTGRGLGLPVVEGIVKAHGGACAAESSPGLGTTVRVYLPLLAERPLPLPMGQSVAFSAVEGRSLVLVVEDEPMLRDLTRTVLESIGYAVVEAANGKAAVEVFRRHRDEIRCVLCDATMPGMDGWATIEALRSIRPDAVVILASGYDEVQVMAGEHAELPQAFLHKPYVTADLKAALAAALQER